MAALSQLVRAMFEEERVLVPELWLKASGELLFLTCLLSLAITAGVNPAFLDENPVKSMLGYNNPCVVWDKAPAHYPAQIIFDFVPVVYCNLR